MDVPWAANDRETRWPHGAGCSPARADLDGSATAPPQAIWNGRLEGERNKGDAGAGAYITAEANSLRGISAREERISIALSSFCFYIIPFSLFFTLCDLETVFFPAMPQNLTTSALDI